MADSSTNSDSEGRVKKETDDAKAARKAEGEAMKGEIKREQEKSNRRSER